MSITTKFTISCDHKNCTNKFVFEGKNASRFTTYIAAKKEGWQRKNGSVQFCPAHKAVKVAKVAKVKPAIKSATKPAVKKFSGKTASIAKAVAKRAPNAAPKKVTSEIKPAPSWTPAPTSGGDGALV
jgi:hypothetical protein